MPTATTKETATVSKKPGIPRPSGIRQSLGHISKASVSKAFTDVLGNKENAPLKETKKPTPVTITKSTVKDSKEKTPSPTLEFGRLNAKASPARATFSTKVVQHARTESSTSSPKSNRKQVVNSPKEAKESKETKETKETGPVLRPREPRESVGTSLPKYRPKTALLPPKQITLTRKRRSSLEETLEEEPEPKSANNDLANRPISPLPRRSRVQSNVSSSSGLFNPKLTLKTSVKSTEIQKTPIKERAGNISTSSSVRIRTMSTATTSSKLSVKNETPSKRTEKRPRLLSESRNAQNTLATSQSTIGADVSSDSIDIADVSALLAVSPAISPARSTAPSSVRRVTVRKPPMLLGAKRPAQKDTPNGLPTRQDKTRLSPAKAATVAVRPGARARNAPRNSILSWADFSSVKLGGEDLNLIAEIAPLKGIVTPGSDDTHFRERVDSGWGLDSPRMFPRVISGPSIGQIMFPTLEVPQEQQPPDGDAVTAKLLRVQLTEAEQDVLELQTRVRQLESQLQGPSGTLGENPAQSKDAELVARVSVLEDTLKNLRLTVSSKDSQLHQMSEAFQQFEEQSALERQEWEERLHTTQELVNTTAFEGEQRTRDSVQNAIAQTMTSEATKWMRKMDNILKIDDTSRTWSDVKNIANSELDYVHQMQATLCVLATGLATIKVE